MTTLNPPTIDAKSAALPLSTILQKFDKAPSIRERYDDPFELLSRLREFSEIPRNELKILSNACRFSTFDPGSYVTIEGDEENTCGFIVASGRIAMLKTSTSGKELIVELLDANDIFGLLVMLAPDKVPAQLSARAIHKSKVLWVPIKDFFHLIKSHPILFKEFVSHLLLCLQSSYRLSRGLAHDRVDIRIASVLSSLALKFGRSTSSSEAFTVYFTRQQIADLTGTTPETAIRVTRAMQRDGLIDIKRPGIIRILDLDGLHSLAEE